MFALAALLTGVGTVIAALMPLIVHWVSQRSSRTARSQSGQICQVWSWFALMCGLLAFTLSAGVVGFLLTGALTTDDNLIEGMRSGVWALCALTAVLFVAVQVRAAFARMTDQQDAIRMGIALSAVLGPIIVMTMIS